MKTNLTEGLRTGDLASLVDNTFTVDQYKSKMGNDEDVVVLGFKVKEKYPATDLMEFIEKGYHFVLDADMSSGEEHDGQYQVFVEMERTPQLPMQIDELLNGVGQLCNQNSWKFRYQKARRSVPFSKDAVMEQIPMTPADYKIKILEIKNKDVQEFFNQGSVSVTLESDNTITFSRPYAGDIKAKLLAIGDYERVKYLVPGKLSLDETSQSQVIFLTKYLGAYDIDKIENKFLIRNGREAIIIEKDTW